MKKVNPIGYLNTCSHLVASLDLGDKERTLKGHEISYWSKHGFPKIYFQQIWSF
jgi:hypothetical protein